jgi:negative regulator of sigma E activity
MKHNDTKHNAQNAEHLLDREALSALMDNELSDFELRRLLSRIEQQPQLLAEWERFGLVRAALQPDPLRSPSSPDFTSRVLNGIEVSIAQDGPLPADSNRQNSPQRSGLAAWTLNTTRFAVAASVTFAVFMGMQAVLQGPGAGEAPAVASGAGSDAQNQQLAVDADAQQRLNDYIRSVTIPARIESQSAPYNVLLDSPQLRPVSDRELLLEVEREPQRR